MPPFFRPWNRHFACSRAGSAPPIPILTRHRSRSATRIRGQVRCVHPEPSATAIRRWPPCAMPTRRTGAFLIAPSDDMRIGHPRAMPDSMAHEWQAIPTARTHGRPRQPISVRCTAPPRRPPGTSPRRPRHGMPARFHCCNASVDHEVQSHSPQPPSRSCRSHGKGPCPGSGRIASLARAACQTAGPAGFVEGRGADGSDTVFGARRSAVEIAELL